MVAGVAGKGPNSDRMASPLVQKLTGVRDLKRILETTVRELGETFNAEACQVMLSNPLDPNVTSICEYRAAPDAADGETCVTMPLVLQGRTFGSVSVSRDSTLTPDEMNAMRVLLGELGDIIRLAQINDIVQRDTFRETFLVEIGNVMTYSMGIGDALFLVVNILGKALQVSRCLFICTDEAQSGWKCYEFWQQDKVPSCQEYFWPSTDSPLVAQVLLSRTPLKVFEGQENSYVSPVQEELQFVNVKSLLGVALRSEKSTHGCVILQQCDYRRAWTRSEIDMVQNVADKVAEALLKLPAEKLAREPIMQLHQRIVTADADQGGSDVQLRRALKASLGQQAIPSARKTSQQPVPAAAKAATPTPPAPPASTAPTPPIPQPAVVPAAEAPQTLTGASQTFTPQDTTQPFPVIAPPAVGEDFAPTTTGEQPVPTIKPVTRTGNTQTFQSLPKPAEMQSFAPQGGGTQDTAVPAAEALARVNLDAKAAPPPEQDPYADLDFGDEFGEPPPAVPAEPAAPPPTPVSNTPTPDTPVAPTPAPAPAPADKAGDNNNNNNKDFAPPEPTKEAAPAAEGGWGNLDSIPTPKGGAVAPAPAVGGWGNLDSIPTPASVPGAGGLRGSMLGKAKATSAASPLMSSLRKGPGKPTDSVAVAEEAPAEAKPFAPADEAAAKKKLDQIMSNSGNETSDYIFATPGLDMRLLGRIDGWVSQIEGKDKYKDGHARQVAQYAVAIAEEIGMKKEDVATIRQAALVHDLGKLGIAQQILQKAEDELEDDQFVLKMGHAVAGAQLLESFPDLKHLGPIVIAHHEEYDGEGFPQGLKGDEIPVAGRILSVANVYHEMVSRKVYGPGMDPEEAQQIMVEGAGSQYDPTLVEALIQAIKSGKVPPAM